MKKKDLEKALKSSKWFIKREGGNHEIWTNGKGDSQPVPRHREINERLAKAIIIFANNNPGD